jgi:transcriptional regulator with XRE-family HTH domain
LRSVYSENYRLFLKLIISARRDSGFTQQELAKILKRPQSFISKYERGERRLDLIEFLEILSALGLDPSDFIKDFINKSGN